LGWRPVVFFELPPPVEDDPVDDDPVEPEVVVPAAALLLGVAAYTAAEAIPAAARQPKATVAVMPVASLLPMLRVSMACS
jgi:hypothetical protein